jgi:hypothetical protein
MTKIKTLSGTVLLFAALASPVCAEEGSRLESRNGWEPINSANQQKPDINSRTRDREATEPGDFTVTDGLSGSGRAWNPTGQVAPGTSNSPAGNAGGE